MKQHVLYISPHLDDAVLSCAGRIAQETALDNKVLVATMFTTADAANEHRYQIRRAEDKAALSLLGASYFHAGLRDAPFRDPHYRSFQNIVFGSANSDEACLAEIVGAILGICDDFRPDQIFFPLGVGTHIDHRLCQAAATCIPPGTAIVFYEDRPYSLVQYATELRLHQIGRWPNDQQYIDKDGSPKRYLDRFDEAFRRARYVHSYTAHQQEIEYAIEHTKHECAQAGKEKVQFAWPQVMAWGAGALEQVSQAVSCYQSQIPDLFGSMDEFARLSKSHIRLLCGEMYAERYWHFHPCQNYRGMEN
jgi:LmbE family N-acetylglucosaminyl deacetylase